MKEHVGKKRRKEVREAYNIKKELNKAWARTLSILGVCIVLVTIVTVMQVTNVIDNSNWFMQYLPVIIAFAGIIGIGVTQSDLMDLRDRYKNHISTFNITKEELAQMKAESNGK